MHILPDQVKHRMDNAQYYRDQIIYRTAVQRSPRSLPPLLTHIRSSIPDPEQVPAL